MIMQVFITPEGKVGAVIESGDFDEARDLLTGLLGDLAEIDIEIIEGAPEIERHTHGDDDEALRRQSKQARS